jgi:uncharacterized protein YqjF (DUF2071 family)
LYCVGGANHEKNAMKAQTPFLTAEWKHLAMLNYAIEPSMLSPFLPEGTELDTWNGTHYVSIVGFLFANTRVSDYAIPFHRNFEEVNLRFYVRRKTDNGWKRGVVFIREIVPRSLIALVAQYLYNEPYIGLPMSHHIETQAGTLQSVRYNWRYDGSQNNLAVVVRGRLQPLLAGSEAEYITEHFWGYNRQRDGSTLEYQVEHPRWRYYDVAEASLQCDVRGLYGSQFEASLSRSPVSVFLAEGSAITVHRGLKLS